jgi:hypothetical protein
MLFEGVEERSKESQNFVRTPIMYTTEGNHIVRFIKDSNLVLNSHYVKGKYTIRCLGDDCPVCNNNRKIIAQEPKNFRNIPGYSSRSLKYIYNIIDKTNVKVCPKCETENKRAGSDFPAKCTACDTFITEVKPTPSNKVKLFVFGQDLASKLSGVEQTYLDKDQNPIGIDKFDTILHVSGTGKDKKTTPIPYTGPELLTIEVKPDMLLDPEKGIITLTVQEVNDLLRGVALKDIFLARKPKTEGSESEKHEVDPQAEALSDEKIQQQVDALFKDA